MEEIEGMTIVKNNEISAKLLITKLIEWFKFIKTKWVLISCFALIGGAFGLIYAIFQKPVFTAATSFVLIDSEKSTGLGQYAGIASMIGVDVGSSEGGVFAGDNILDLYKSRRMIVTTLLTNVKYNGKDQLLIDLYMDFNGLKEKWADNPLLKNIQFKSIKAEDFDLEKTGLTRLQDSILGTVVSNINKKYLNVDKPDKKLNTIIVEVNAPNEFFAKAFDEQIVKNVSDFYIQTKTKKSVDNITILQKKTDSVRNVMNGSIFTSAAVNDATPNLNVTRQIQRVVPIQKSQFNVETNKSILTELVKNLELSKMSLMKEAPLIQIIDRPVFPLEKQKTGKLRGIILGSFMGAFLTAIIIILKKIFSNIMN